MCDTPEWWIVFDIWNFIGGVDEGVTRSTADTYCTTENNQVHSLQRGLFTGLLEGSSFATVEQVCHLLVNI